MIRQNVRGISLIEVLAALVILSLGASVAFSWFGQSVTAMGKLKAEEVRLLAENEAVDALRAIQLSKREVLDVLAQGREGFSTTEWRDLLLRSVGFEHDTWVEGK